MIKKLSHADNGQVMDYLSDEKALNLFIIGDIENFGYDTSFQEVWADYENDEIKAVMLRYYNSYIVYAKGLFDVEGLTDIIKYGETCDILSGKKEVIEQFNEVMSFKKKKELYFAELINDEHLNKELDRSSIRIATVSDVDDLYELRKKIVEFDFNRNAKEGMKQALETKTGRTYFIMDEDKVISSASTTAENSLSAMVVGVSTDPNYRKKGLATQCMNALCDDVLNEGKTLCLFYDNPEAGKIYKRLGFNDIGMWVMHYPEGE